MLPDTFSVELKLRLFRARKPIPREPERLTVAPLSTVRLLNTKSARVFAPEVVPVSPVLLKELVPDLETARVSVLIVRVSPEATVTSPPVPEESNVPSSGSKSGVARPPPSVTKLKVAADVAASSAAKHAAAAQKAKGPRKWDEKRFTLQANFIYYV